MRKIQRDPSRAGRDVVSEETLPAPPQPDPTVPWFVYILRCGDQSLYTGIALEVERRIAEHSKGKGSRYTQSRLPVTLVYHEKMPDKSSALKREAEIKKWSRTRKLTMISGDLEQIKKF